MPIVQMGKDRQRGGALGSRSPIWSKEGKESQEQGFLPHASHLSTAVRWRGLGRPGCGVITLPDSTVPSPSWALTRSAGWGAPGAHEALLGAPCPVGPTRGPGTGPGWEAVLRPQLLLDGRSSSAARGQGRGLAEGRRLCAQGAGSTQRRRAERGGLRDLRAGVGGACLL